MDVGAMSWIETGGMGRDAGKGVGGRRATLVWGIGCWLGGGANAGCWLASGKIKGGGSVGVSFRPPADQPTWPPPATPYGPPSGPQPPSSPAVMSSWLASLWPAHAAAAPPAPVLPPSSFLPGDAAAPSASTPSDAASQPAPGARSPSSASSQAPASRHAGPNLPIDAVYIPPDEMLGRPAVLQHLPYSKSLRDPAAFIKPEMAPGAKAPPSREPTPQGAQQHSFSIDRGRP